MVNYGGDELEQCVTGAPNLFDYKGIGLLPRQNGARVRQRGRGGVGRPRRQSQAR